MGDNLRTLPIDALPFKIRVFSMLEDDYPTIGALCDMTAATFLRTPKLGRGSLEDTIRVLCGAGLSDALLVTTALGAPAAPKPERVDTARPMSFRIPPDLIERLDAVAKAEDRNRTQQLVRYLRQGLARDEAEADTPAATLAP